MAGRVVVEEIPGSVGRGYLVRSTGPIDWDRDDVPEGLPLATLAERVAQRPPKRIVVHVHGYNNPEKVARARAQAAWDAYFSHADRDTLYLAYLWPSEQGLWPTRIGWSWWALPTLPLALTLLGLLATLNQAIRPNPFDHRWTLAGGVLLGFVGYLAFLRFAAYYRDQYRADQYGVPDLVETVRVVDAALPDGLERNSVDLSFLGHSMGAFVVTSAVRILVDGFAPPPPAIPLTDPVERGKLSAIGKGLRLSNLVLVSPDIPVQAIVSPRLNSLAESLSRFRGRFLFTNVGDVVLDPISTSANSPVVPVLWNRRNARLGNLAVLPEKPRASGFFDAVDVPEYTARLRTPNGPLAKLVERVGNRPWVPIQAGERLHGVRLHRGERPAAFAMFGGTRFPALVRLLMLLSYLAKVVLKRVGQDGHSGYFDHPRLRRALFGAVEMGKPDLDGESDLASWACRVNVRAIGLAEERQVQRATQPPGP